MGITDARLRERLQESMSDAQLKKVLEMLDDDDVAGAKATIQKAIQNHPM